MAASFGKAHRYQNKCKAQSRSERGFVIPSEVEGSAISFGLCLRQQIYLTPDGGSFGKAHRHQNKNMSSRGEAEGPAVSFRICRRQQIYLAAEPLLYFHTYVATLYHRVSHLRLPGARQSRSVRQPRIRISIVIS